MLSILRIGKYNLRTLRGEWASYSPQHCLSYRLDVLARLAAYLVLTGVKLVYPWGRHFLRVCLQSFTSKDDDKVSEPAVASGARSDDTLRRF
jgi:hypothetical protein